MERRERRVVGIKKGNKEEQKTWHRDGKKEGGGTRIIWKKE